MQLTAYAQEWRDTELPVMTAEQNRQLQEAAIAVAKRAGNRAVTERDIRVAAWRCGFIGRPADC